MTHATETLPTDTTVESPDAPEKMERELYKAGFRPVTRSVATLEPRGFYREYERDDGATARIESLHPEHATRRIKWAP